MKSLIYFRDRLLSGVRLGSGYRKLSWFRSEPAGTEADYRILINGGYFDASFYISTYFDIAQAGVDPALHYLRIGYREGRRPSALFDHDAYMVENPDVRAAGINPLVHWLRYGAKEGRNSPFRPVQPEPQPLSDEAVLNGVFYPRLAWATLDDANRSLPPGS